MDPIAIFEKIVAVIEPLENIGVPPWVLNLLMRLLVAVIPKIYRTLKRKKCVEKYDEKTS